MNATTAHEKILMPQQVEKEAAVESQRMLAAYISTQAETQIIQITADDGKVHGISMPTSALHMLQEILVALSMGDAVKVVPVHAELTTQQAADILNVSRPYVVNLMETGALKFHKTGTHRRVLFSDLQEYKELKQRESMAAMTELTALDQELGLGY